MTILDHLRCQSKDGLTEAKGYAGNETPSVEGTIKTSTGIPQEVEAQARVTVSPAFPQVEKPSLSLYPGLCHLKLSNKLILHYLKGKPDLTTVVKMGSGPSDK